MIDPLSRLAIQYGTDKFGYHDYTPKYHLLLQHLRERPLKMLEIGVGGYGDPDAGGESLQVWRDYFPRAQIVGIDIARKSLDLGSRVDILRGSQVDVEFLEKLVAQHGPFDIILDDGSHQNAHVVESFRLLFETLQPGGFYIVEDVQTAFFPRFGGSLELSSPNSVGFFADRCAELVSDAPQAADIAQMWRFHNIFAIQKTGEDQLAQPEPTQTLDGPTADLGAFSDIPEGGALRLSRLDHLSDDMRQRFVEVDHREMAVFHPDVQVSDLATSISAFHAARGAVTLQRGPNDYPSNFRFQADHPEARAALAVYRAVLDETPTERGLQVYGRLVSQAGWDDETDFAADTLEAKGAEEPDSLHLIIRAAKRVNDEDRRRSTIARAYDLHPKNVNFVGQMVGMLMRDGEMSRAEEILLEAREDGLESADISMWLSLVYLRQKHFDEALSEGQTATRLRPNGLPGWRALIRAHMASGQYAEAEAACSRAIDRCAPTAGLFLSLSEARLAQADLQGAREALDRAVEMDPDQAQIAKLKARIDAA